MQSSISEPSDGAIIDLPAQRDSEGSEILLRGFAYSGGGRRIIRVDVSADRGRTWLPARLQHPTPPLDSPQPHDDSRTNHSNITDPDDVRHVLPPSTPPLHKLPLRSDRSWTWTPWAARVRIPASAVGSDGKLRIMCKAVDNSYNVQPETLDGIHNLRGVLVNSWHHVDLVANGTSTGDAARKA